MNPVKFLVVDDNADFLEFLTSRLSMEGDSVSAFGSAEDAIEYLQREESDLAILDIKLPGMNGIELLKRIKEIHPGMEVILLTGYSEVETAIQAMRWGAYDYLTKPCRIEELRLIIQRALERRKLLKENVFLKEEVFRRRKGTGLIGKSPVILSVLKLIEKVAAAQSTVLIQGESGSGKELVAYHIHQKSSRKGNPYVVVDCSALQENLLENELFGHEKGAFTDATKDKRGLIEMADTGTLFLDEIGEISKNLQAKLLRVLETSEFRPLGSNHSVKVNIRVIAATNRNLQQEVRLGNFREDLFYRLNTITVHAPSLRDRKEDISVLAHHFLAMMGYGGGKRKEISQEAIRKLEQYSWPGNVRELANVIERAVILSEGTTILPDDIQLVLTSDTRQVQGEPLSDGPFTGLDDHLQSVEKRVIEKAIAECRNNITEAAKKLKLTRQKLYRKIAKYQIRLD